MYMYWIFNLSFNLILRISWSIAPNTARTFCTDRKQWRTSAMKLKHMLRYTKQNQQDTEYIDTDESEK